MKKYAMVAGICLGFTFLEVYAAGGTGCEVASNWTPLQQGVAFGNSQCTSSNSQKLTCYYDSQNTHEWCIIGTTWCGEGDGSNGYGGSYGCSRAYTKYKEHEDCGIKAWKQGGNNTMTCSNPQLPSVSGVTCSIQGQGGSNGPHLAMTYNYGSGSGGFPCYGVSANVSNLNCTQCYSSTKNLAGS